MKKFILILLSILLLFTFPVSTYGTTDTINDSVQVMFNKGIQLMKDNLKVEAKNLAEEIHNAKDEETRKELINKTILTMSEADAKYNLKDYYVSGNKVKLVIEVIHQYNLKNYFDYYSRVERSKEYYSERDEALPWDLEIKCFNETLDLCKNRATKFDMELEAAYENDTFNLEDLNFTSSFSALKSLLF